jgi:hypothetical protein
LHILMIGDVVGKGGRNAVRDILPRLRSELRIDFVTVQGENIAGGNGLTVDTVNELLRSGADVITTGNHVWDQKEFIERLDDPALPVLRPLNYPAAAPGRGAIDAGPVAVINLLGRVFVGESDSPFAVVDELLASGFGAGKPLIVDFHAEASSEKHAMAWHLDGRVSALVGTHTHVPTADTRILPGGTAFVTDLGMVGALESVIGVEVEDVLARFLTGVPRRLRPVETGVFQFNSVLIDINDATGKARSVQRVDREWQS